MNQLTIAQIEEWFLRRAFHVFGDVERKVDSTNSRKSASIVEIFVREASTRVVQGSSFISSRDQFGVPDQHIIISDDIIIGELCFIGMESHFFGHRVHNSWRISVVSDY